MRVLQVNSVCGTGSTGRIAVQICRVAAASGWQSEIAYGRGRCEAPGARRFESRAGFYMHVLTTRLFDRHGLGSRRATDRLIRMIREFAPDVIHLHNIHGYYVNYAQLFGFLKTFGRPVVWTLHDCWAFTGHCAFFEAAGCEKWQTGCAACPQKNLYPASRLADRSRKNFADKKAAFCGVPNMTITVPSQWLADTVRRSFLREYPARVIHNGVDFGVFRPDAGQTRARYGIGDRFMMLGAASVWEDRKGLHDFVEMASRLEPGEVIVLAGLNKKQIRALPGGIIGIERTRDAAALAELYSAADVFLNPTREDTFPTTNIEAMACGTPVITYDTGGSAESVEKGCGIALAEKTAEAMLAAARGLKARRPGGAASCRQRAQAHFDMDRQFGEYVRLYEALAGRPRSGG